MTVPLPLRLQVMMVYGLIALRFALKVFKKRNPFFKVHSSLSQLDHVIRGSAIALFLCWLILWHTEYSYWSVLLCAVAPLLLVFLPLRLAGPDLRHKLRTTLLQAQLSSILVADVLTSYAKVFADWEVLLFCSIRTPGIDPALSCSIGLLGMSLSMTPYALRFVQCLLDYRHKKSYSSLVNALKYLLSFPLIYIGTMVDSTSKTHNGILMLIALSTVLNIGWDLLMDWKIRLDDTFYQVAIPMNILIRLLWAYRLLCLCYYKKAWSSVAELLLMIAEITRRMVWLIARLEREQGSGVFLLPLHK